MNDTPKMGPGPTMDKRPPNKEEIAIAAITAAYKNLDSRLGVVYGAAQWGRTYKSFLIQTGKILDDFYWRNAPVPHEKLKKRRGHADPKNWPKIGIQIYPKYIGAMSAVNKTAAPAEIILEVSGEDSRIGDAENEEIIKDFPPAPKILTKAEKIEKLKAAALDKLKKDIELI